MRDHNGFNRRRFDLVIGHRLFTDGAERAVHLSAEGGQYVLDEAGMPVNGVWLLLPKRNCLDRDERRLPIRFWLWEPITEFLERIAAKDRPQVRMHIAVFHEESQAKKKAGSSYPWRDRDCGLRRFW